MSGFTETHRTNMFSLWVSFLFTKGGFSNAALDHGGEMKKCHVVSSELF